MFYFSKTKFLMLTCLAALLLQGCMALKVRQPLPEHLLDQAQVADLPGIRAWGDVSSESLEQSAIESIRQEMAANHGKLEPEANFLALSGGGDGAFGAGILCGWTEAGTRPRFKLVTGISTGALIAPFAFLGPEYDAKLKAAYTTISDKDIYTTSGLVKLLFNLGRIESVANTKPLAELLVRPWPWTSWQSWGLIPTSNQKTIICHSERSEESLFLSRRDSSLRCAPFRMT